MTIDPTPAVEQSIKKSEPQDHLVPRVPTTRFPTPLSEIYEMGASEGLARLATLGHPSLSIDKLLLQEIDTGLKAGLNANNTMFTQEALQKAVETLRTFGQVGNIESQIQEISVEDFLKKMQEKLEEVTVSCVFDDGEELALSLDLNDPNVDYTTVLDVIDHLLHNHRPAGYKKVDYTLRIKGGRTYAD